MLLLPLKAGWKAIDFSALTSVFSSQNLVSLVWKKYPTKHEAMVIHWLFDSSIVTLFSALLFSLKIYKIYMYICITEFGLSLARISELCSFNGKFVESYCK